MERLTSKIEDAIIQCPLIKALDDDNDYCKSQNCDCDNCKLGKQLVKLAKYENAEEQGLLLRLPVAEGTTVYELIKIIDYGEVGDKGEFRYYHRKTKFCRNMIEEFGETVFLTEGQVAQKIHDIEAEQALAKMKEV